MRLDKFTCNVIISPFSYKLRNGKENPKNYPYWQKLIVLLRENGFRVTQIGISNEEKLHADNYLFDAHLSVLRKEIEECFIWISVDSFLNHFGTYCGKKGIVLWGQSDPDIFGYDENINLIKDRKNLRKDQFNIWEMATYNKNVFVEPEVVIDYVLKEKGKEIQNYMI